MEIPGAGSRSAQVPQVVARVGPLDGWSAIPTGRQLVHERRRREGRDVEHAVRRTRADRECRAVWREGKGPDGGSEVEPVFGARLLWIDEASRKSEKLLRILGPGIVEIAVEWLERERHLQRVDQC